MSVCPFVIAVFLWTVKISNLAEKIKLITPHIHKVLTIHYNLRKMYFEGGGVIKLLEYKSHSFVYGGGKGVSFQKLTPHRNTALQHRTQKYVCFNVLFVLYFQRHSQK